MATSRKKWKARTREHLPVPALDGVFVRQITFGQLREMQGVAPDPKRVENEIRDETVLFPLINWLWTNIVVDGDGRPFDVDPADVTALELSAVQEAIQGQTSGEALGTLGDKQPPTS